MTTYICPNCGSDQTEYIGYSDGAGDYGDEIGEDYQCDNCMSVFTPRTWPVPEESEIDWIDQPGEGE